MADEKNRRVEPRSGVAGSGMLTDPERLESIERDRARMMRSWRDAPARSFGRVLDDAAAADAPQQEPKQDRRRRAPSPAPARDDDAEADVADGQAPEAEKAALPERPRVPPDPRQRALHASLTPVVPGPAEKVESPARAAPPPPKPPKAKPRILKNRGGGDED